MEIAENCFNKFEEQVNMFNLGLSALINSEHGEGQLSDGKKLEAFITQIEYYETALAELNKSLNGLPCSSSNNIPT